MTARRDDPKTMREMTDWLQAASYQLELPNEIIDSVQKPLLRLISTVAHGPSRPGAPLSAYLVGFLAGQGGDPLEAIEALEKLARDYTAEEPSE